MPDIQTAGILKLALPSSSIFLLQDVLVNVDQAIYYGTIDCSSNIFSIDTLVFCRENWPALIDENSSNVNVPFSDSSILNTSSQKVVKNDMSNSVDPKLVREQALSSFKSPHKSRPDHLPSSLEELMSSLMPPSLSSQGLLNQCGIFDDFILKSSQFPRRQSILFDNFLAPALSLALFLWLSWYVLRIGLE